MDQDLHQLLKALVARHTLSTNEAGSCENAQVQTSMPWQEHLASLSVRLEALCAIPAFLGAVEASASQIGVTEGADATPASCPFVNSAV